MRKARDANTVIINSDESDEDVGIVSKSFAHTHKRDSIALCLHASQFSIPTVFPFVLVFLLFRASRA